MTSLIIKRWIPSVVNRLLDKIYVEKQMGTSWWVLQIMQHSVASWHLIRIGTWEKQKHQKIHPGRNTKTVEVKTNANSGDIWKQALSESNRENRWNRENCLKAFLLLSNIKMNGEKIGTFKTDKEGMIYISDLEDGYYTVTETEGLENYHWDKDENHWG